MSEQITPAEGVNGAAVEYGPAYFQNYWGGGGAYERNERWLKFFGAVADGIVRDLHPVKALDAGCALGFLVEALHDRGVDAHGIDISEYAITQVDDSVRDRCRVASLTAPIEDRYDLITCIEVVEHLPPSEIDAALDNLCSATDQLLLSTTPQDYGEPTHLNVQPPEYWTAALARRGFLRDLERDFSYLSPWAGLYRRSAEPLVDVVRDYDRAWWRQRREVHEVRGSLLATQERLTELERAAAKVDNRPELLHQLDRQQEEILRLRDLLMARDAELGSAHGQLAAAQHGALRAAGAAARIQARIPGLTRVLALRNRLKR
jgi:Methyltransferase domain